MESIFIYLFGIYFYRKKVGLAYVYIFLNAGEEGEIYCDNCLFNGLKFLPFDPIEDDKLNHLKELMAEWIKKMNTNYILKMARGNTRRYSKSKENGRQCSQRMLKRYNSTSLRLKEKLAAKNNEFYPLECRVFGDLDEINKVTYESLHRYRKEKVLLTLA